MTEPSERRLSGRCHCGRISYVVTGEPIAVGHCYCVHCKRLSGAGHSTGALFPESSFAIEGIVTEYSFEPKPGITDTRLFCSTCGSQVLGRNSAAPGMLSLGLGTLDEVSALEPRASIYVGQKAHWDLVDERTRVFEGTAAGQLKLTR